MLGIAQRDRYRIGTQRQLVRIFKLDCNLDRTGASPMNIRDPPPGS